MEEPGPILGGGQKLVPFRKGARGLSSPVLLDSNGVRLRREEGGRGTGPYGCGRGPGSLGSCGRGIRPRRGYCRRVRRFTFAGGPFWQPEDCVSCFKLSFAPGVFGVEVYRIYQQLGYFVVFVGGIYGRVSTSPTSVELAAGKKRPTPSEGRGSTIPDSHNRERVGVPENQDSICAPVRVRRDIVWLMAHGASSTIGAYGRSSWRWAWSGQPVRLLLCGLLHLARLGRL